MGAIYLDRGYDACMHFIRNRVLGQLISLEKVAAKEVNFKSKLLEWTQKNRVKIEFRLLSQKSDKGSPVFEYQVLLEGVEGCSATGYSKKESQQKASKLTLEQLRRKPQFIDEVFAAKSNRTKMEEEPATAVPKIEEEGSVETLNQEESTPKMPEKKQKIVTEDDKIPVSILDDEEFDLSDISAREQSREEIIAAAEAAAYEK